jgi:hypothetical protein
MAEVSDRAQFSNKTNFFQVMRDTVSGVFKLVVQLDTPIDLNGAAVTFDVSNLALEAGGNLEALLASIGAPSDAAWNGTDANATAISLLKAIALNTTLTP